MGLRMSGGGEYGNLPFTFEHAELARNFGTENSPCLRRKYGVIIADNYGEYIYAANTRVGKECTDKYCIRDMLGVQSNTNTEIGAEIHAEQAALIKWAKINISTYSYHILIAGTNHIGPLDGMQNKPCYACAKMIKFAGFDFIWMPFGDRIAPVSISGVIEEYEFTHQDI